MKTKLEYLELRKEQALKKVIQLFEAGYYVSHTNIAKEFRITQNIMRKMLKTQPDNFFLEMKNQNRRIAADRLQVRGVTRYLENKRNEINAPIDFTDHDRKIFKEIRKTAKVVVKLPNENDLDFKLFKSKAVGGEFSKEYKGSFKEYVCGVGRKQISY